MPSLERTAYPRFGRVITAQELERAYTPSQEELTWARGTVRYDKRDGLQQDIVGRRCFQP